MTSTNLFARVFGLLLMLGAAGDALACDATTPCPVLKDFDNLGEYLVRQPEGAPAEAGAKRPALFFIHGWRDNAGNVIANKSLLKFADEIGAVLVAPNGLRSTWSYPGSPTQARDEFAFFDALRQDVIAQHDVDPDRIVVAGFSMGGSMAWNLACHRGDEYWGFIAFAGAFWTPMPARCDRPARRLIHIHGETDKVVPIEGRPIRTHFAQADAVKSMKVLLDSSLLKGTREGARDMAGLACKRWGASGRLVEFCRHGGGHMWKAGWLRAAYEALRAR